MTRVLLLVAVFVRTACVAQDLPPTTEQQLENLAEEIIDDDALLQQLTFFRRHPINLNTADADDLRQLRFLTGLQIENFLRYRARFGKLVHLYELQAVPGFDVATIRRLLPYIIVGSNQDLRETFTKRLRQGEGEALLRYARIAEKAKGYKPLSSSRYLGTPDRLFARYRYQYKNLLYYGVLADKDAGERFFRGAQRLGFDFYSAHVFVRNLGRFKAVALGDYTVNLGQGLLQWQSLGFGKSADVLAIKRQSAVLGPYRSAGELYFNRGAGASLAWKRWELTGFVSAKRFTGNLAMDSVPYFTSFNSSGYHRTAGEWADRNRLTHFSAGGSLQYRVGSLAVSVNSVWHRFSRPLRKSAEPYNRFAFTGSELFQWSLSYSYTHHNLHLFGETALDRQWQPASVNGLLLSLHRRVDLSLLHRRFPARFPSLFGNAFAESPLPQNEHGVYAGLALRPADRWRVAAYADVYRFPFLRYRISAPTAGSDFLLQASFTPNKQTEIYLRYRNESKPENQRLAGMAIDAPLPWFRQNLRLHFATALSGNWVVKGRAEMLWYQKEGKGKEEGYLCFAELAGALGRRLKGNVRLQYFETDGFDSRIYAYESDVLYSFSIPAFFDKGFRYYTNLQWSPTARVQLWFRLAQTVFPQRINIGSGLEEIEGNRRTQLTAQLRYLPNN